MFPQPNSSLLVRKRLASFTFPNDYLGYLPSPDVVRHPRPPTCFFFFNGDLNYTVPRVFLIVRDGKDYRFCLVSFFGGACFLSHLVSLGAWVSRVDFLGRGCS